MSLKFFFLEEESTAGYSVCTISVGIYSMTDILLPVCSAGLSNPEKNEKSLKGYVHSNGVDITALKNIYSVRTFLVVQ